MCLEVQIRIEVQVICNIGNYRVNTGCLKMYSIDFGTESQMFPRPSLDKPVLKNYQLRAHIYQGKELPAGDANGTHFFPT